MHVHIPQVDSRPFSIILVVSRPELEALAAMATGELRARQVDISGVDDVDVRLRLADRRQMRLHGGERPQHGRPLRWCGRQPPAERKRD